MVFHMLIKKNGATCVALPKDTGTVRIWAICFLLFLRERAPRC
jgi:hypothetical protein